MFGICIDETVLILFRSSEHIDCIHSGCVKISSNVVLQEWFDYSQRIVQEAWLLTRQPIVLVVEVFD